MGTLICDICGENEAHVHRITRSYAKKKNLFIIENIPVVSCSSCDGSYLTAETMHEIESIKMHKGRHRTFG